MTSEANAAEVAAMQRAVALAAHSPLTGGNPRVGCVILAPSGEVIAEGWHRGAGTPHAEVDALSHVPADAALGATAVVTLEPCNHFGRTGPCSHALVEAGVSRVVYAIDDPGRASGGGAAYLRSHGIEVVEGALAEAAREVNHDWLVSMQRGWPWVILKLATTLDGRAAASDRSSQWITSAESREHAHRIRSEVDGILVGIGTVLADDPALTARLPDGRLRRHQPTPIVLGGPLPAQARLQQAPTPVRVLDLDPRELREAPADQARLAIESALRELFASPRTIRRLLVEGGPSVASLFLRARLVDEIHAYLAPKLLGGSTTALGDIGVQNVDDAIELATLDFVRLGPDLLWRARVTPRESAEAAPGTKKSERKAGNQDE